MFLEENFCKEYIRPSQSPIASLFFFVAKKDRGLCPCQNYRYLNEGMVKNTYLLPLISKLINKLAHAIIFTKLNLRSGYNNMHIWDRDQ